MRRSAYAVAGAVGLGLALVGQFALSGAATASPNPSPGARAQEAIQSGAAIAHRDAGGRVRYLSTNRGHAIAQASRSISGAAAARANINDFAPIFGVANPATDLKQVQSIKGPNGPIVRFQQIHNGVPVIGGQLIVSDNASGALVAINGVAGDADAVDTTAHITSDVAGRLAIGAMSHAAKGLHLTATKPTLSVYDPSLLGAPDALGPRAVYQVTVTDPSAQRVNQYVLIDANTGHVALSFSQIETFAAGRTGTTATTATAPTPAVAPATPPTQYATDTVCDYSNQVFGDYNSNCPNSTDGISPIADPLAAGGDAAAAYELTGQVNNFYNDVLGRQGIDGANMGLVSSVRFCYDNQTGDCPYPNAFWDGSQMVFGDGFAGADDVVAHELTHGVTQHTSNLLYYYQSGAVNESMSDVMGELFDQYNVGDPVVPGQDGPSFDWLLGEDLPGGAIRSMSNPHAYGQPETMTDSAYWNSEPYDAGGVHINSGVGNYAGYLVATGISDGNALQKTAAIWLGADELMSPAAQYTDLASALHQSCQNLLAGNTDGISSADCAVVDSAITTTQMTTQAPDGSLAQAVRCGGSFRPRTVFTDYFNRTASGSLGSSWYETGSASIDGEASPAPTTSIPTSGAMIKPGGNALYIPEPVENGSPVHRYVQTANYLTLSSAHQSFVYFNHLDSFDWTYVDGYGNPLAYYDGGVLEYQVSGTTSWTSLSSSTWINGPNKAIASHGGAKGFGGDSRGWVSSRVAVPTSLEGKPVKFRWSVYTDGITAFSSAYGWWIDNVSVHDCITSPLAPTSVLAKGYHNAATLSWAAASTNGGSAINAYALYRQEVGVDSAPVWVTNVSASTLSYTFKSLASNKDYIFKIRARNKDNQFSPAVAYTLHGSKLTISASSIKVHSGSSVTITGKLTNADNGHPFSSTVRLYYRKHGTSTWYSFSTTVKSDSTGTYKFTVKPTVSTDYAAVYSVGSTYFMGTASPIILVSVY